MNTERKGYLFVFVAGFLWGTIGLFVKQLSLHGANADTIALLRVGFSFIIMLFVCLALLGAKRMCLSVRQLIACALLGIVTQAVFNICYSLAIESVGVSVSSVLLYISPVFTLLFSMLLFSERLSKEKVLAIVTNIIGCILTVTNGCLDISSLNLDGILFGVAAGFCYSLAAIIGRIATKDGNPLLTAMYSFFFATVFLLLRSPFTKTRFVFSSEILIWGFFFALIATSITYIVYYKGVEMIKETSKVPVMASTEVVVASLVGVLLYGERIRLVSLVGIILVLSSILMLSFRSKR